MKIDGFLQEVYVVNLLLLVKLMGNEVTPHKKKIIKFFESEISQFFDNVHKHDHHGNGSLKCAFFGRCSRGKNHSHTEKV